MSNAITRDLVEAEAIDDPALRATRLRALRSSLRGARKHIDVRTGKIRRRLGDLAQAWERRVGAEAAARWLEALGRDDSIGLEADDRMEVGARRHRLADTLEDLESRIHTASSRLPRGRIRRLVRSLPSAPTEDPTVPTEAKARKEEV